MNMLRAHANTVCKRLLAIALALSIWAGVAVAFAQPGEMYMPKESGYAVECTNGTYIDYGNSGEGYVTVRQQATKKTLMLAISHGGTRYIYDLNSKGRAEVYPLQMGEGRYTVEVYQQVTGNRYTVLDKLSFDVEFENQHAPFLYPSQYVNYNPSTLAVAKANELCKKTSNTRQTVEAIFKYIKKTIKYNKKRAKTVKEGYLPDLNEVFRSRKGICFDYAALMACMLRSQGVPAQLVIGYVNGKSYHAWNKVLIDGQWVLYDPTFAAAGSTGKSYSEERRY